MKRDEIDQQEEMNQGADFWLECSWGCAPLCLEVPFPPPLLVHLLLILQSKGDHPQTVTQNHEDSQLLQKTVT